MGRLRRPRKSGWLKKLRTAFAGNRVDYACDRRAKATRSLRTCEDNSLAIATVAALKEYTWQLSLPRMIKILAYLYSWTDVFWYKIAKPEDLISRDFVDIYSTGIFNAVTRGNIHAINSTLYRHSKSWIVGKGLLVKENQLKLRPLNGKMS